MRKRNYLLIVNIFFIIVLLSGCSAVDEFQNSINKWMEKRLLAKAGITKDESYLLYEQNREAGLLDEHGYYIADGQASEKNGTIYLTFAENRDLDISYYYDQELSHRIDSNGCYLNPGDSIYVSKITSKSSTSDLYSFSRFRFIEYDKDGNRLGETDGIHEENGIIVISKDFNGTQVAVEPIGKYDQRMVSLKAYWINSEGEENVINDGTWIINDEVYQDAETEINPNESYIVQFEYDAQKYYFVGASGEIHSQNEKDGKIIFKEVVATNGIGNFRVELHPYSSFVITDTKGIVSVSVAGRDAIDVISKKMVTDVLKPGDFITVITDKDYKIICDQKSISPSYISDSENQFDITITDDDYGEMEISTSKWGTKTISVDVDENAFWDKVKNNYLDWLPFVNTEENSFIKVSTGDDEYIYSDLQNGKSIKLSERNKLTITIDKKTLNGFSVLFKVDSKDPIRVDKNSKTFSYDYTFNDISELSIELIEE